MPRDSHQKEIIRRRRIVRHAFDLVRHDNRHRVSRGRFLEALAGRSEMSDGIVRLATVVTEQLESQRQ